MTSGEGDSSRAPLQAIGMGLSVPADVMTRLRTAFPGIRFVVSVEEAPGKSRHQVFSGDLAPDDLHDADALIGWDLDAKLLANAPRLRWMHAASAGVDHFDLPAIAARGVMLTNSRGVLASNIAEHVLGMMIAQVRRFPRLARAQAARQWRDSETHREVGELHGQTLLIVGMGEIGRAVAERAAVFGMHVDGVRRHGGGERPAAVRAMVDLASLAAALGEADHVVITLPDTPRTRGLFDAAMLSAMKPGAAIYNVGRGPVIDTAALIAALESGQLSGAGLDVTDPEPLPVDSPLWDMDNVQITAHTSGATPRFWDRLEPLIVENIRRWQGGEPLRNVVDLEAGY